MEKWYEIHFIGKIEITNMTQTLQEFLQSERKEFEDLMVLTNSTVNLPLWLSSHDTRLIAHLREMIEKKIAIHKELSQQWTGISVGKSTSEYTTLTRNKDNVHTFVIEQLEDLLSLLTPPTKV